MVRTLHPWRTVSCCYQVLLNAMGRPPINQAVPVTGLAAVLLALSVVAQANIQCGCPSQASIASVSAIHLFHQCGAMEQKYGVATSPHLPCSHAMGRCSKLLVLLLSLTRRRRKRRHPCAFLVRARSSQAMKTRQRALSPWCLRLSLRFFSV